MLEKLKNFISKYKFLIAGLILIFCVLILILVPTFSEKTSSTIWDGSIASSFADGDGTQNNPYIISNGSELAYLFTKLKSEDSSLYFNKFYEIENNINFDGRDFSFIDATKTFSGTINGNGYILSNLTLNTCSLNEETNTCEYALFSNLNNATIKNINISNLTITSNSINNHRSVAVISTSATNSNINNVSLSNIEYKITSDQNYETKSSGLLINDNQNNTIGNIHIDLNDNNSNTSNLIYTYNYSTISNIIYHKNNAKLFNNVDTEISSSYGYNKTNNIITFENKYPVKTILKALNKNSELTWAYADNTIRMRNTGVDEVQTIAESSSITSHESGISGSTIYINDFIADYDYYMGLNYTTSNNRNIPTRLTKNIYSEKNLVYVASTYKGTDYNNQNTGYVSLTEQQDTYVYYKVYEVNTNGTPEQSDDYIEYELIDNPFADRPNDKAFNGWVTDYSNAEITLDRDIYVRKVKIPVTYENGKPKPIEITFYASWIQARTYNISGSYWNNAFNYFYDEGLKLAKGTVAYWDIEDLYYAVTVARNEPIYAGDFEESWSGWQKVTSNGVCNSSYCDIRRPAANTEYEQNRTYYELVTSSSFWGTTYDFTEKTPQYISDTNNAVSLGDLAGGLYRRVKLPYRESLIGYYDIDGNMMTSGTCNQTNGCNYYEIINLKNENGTVETVIEGVEYYYLVTRDTNIAFVTDNISGAWSNQTKPFTLTSINNNINNINRYYWNMNSNVQIGADTRIEMTRINSRQSMQNGDSGPITSRSILGNYYNLKIGRGIKQYNSNASFSSAAGGSTSFYGTTVKRYTFIVESGYYNNLGLTTITSSSGTHYVLAYGTYGNDYDRVTNNNNNLIVQYCASGSWAGTIRSTSTSTIALNTTVKSGNIGRNNYDYAAGLYVGGRNNGNHYVIRKAIIEGGTQANVIGGPLSVENNVKSGTTFLNDTFIYIKGGSPSIVVGGAGASSTYGNRIIQVTGGTIGYAVFGGSNGVSGSDGGTYPGILYGDSYVYIGGHATIGNGSNNNHSVSAVESGSVFGAGNGNSTSVGVGSVNNSYVVIDGDATINKNVYGGGNYGATGYGNSTTYNPTHTEIVINGGTIKGSVYGAGNNNGSGNYAHTVTSGSGWNQTRVNYYNINSEIKIEMTGGTVTNGIYGGSNIKGIVYGKTEVNILNGNVKDVYGGGEGQNTYVRDNVDVTIGSNEKGPNISGNVYGGSAYGTVNDTINNGTSNNKTVKVTVNNGTITGDVFGGAKGNSTTVPYVKGNIAVNINGGTIANVYGGFDANGSPENQDFVYLNGGVIGSAFGGGKNTSQTQTNIYLKGAEVGYIYGGSNQSGTVNNTNVFIQSGTSNYVFGGNNLGGTCNQTNVNMSGGTVKENLLGGGNAVETTTTNVNISNGKVKNAFGGGNEAGVTNETNVNVTGGNITNAFGGSNKTGNVAKSNVILNTNTTKPAGESKLKLEVTTTSRKIEDWEKNNYGTNFNSIRAVKVTVKNNTNKTINSWAGTLNIPGSKLYNNYSSDTNVIDNNGLYSFTSESRWTSGTHHVLSPNGTYSFEFNALSETPSGQEVGYDYQFEGNSTDGESFTDTNMGFRIYGGNNLGGNTNESNITLNNGYAMEVYGGNNLGGTTVLTNIKFNNGTIESIYGGGNQAESATTNIDLNGGTSTNVFGGGNQAEVTTSNININSGTSINIYGGGNQAGVQTTNLKTTTATTMNATNIFGGSNQSGNVTKANIDIKAGTYTNIYGGNNKGGVTTEPIIDISNGTIHNVYGGGNEAVVTKTKITITGGNINDVYGGGNAAAITENTNLTITGGTINHNTYGGGNFGIVDGSTNVVIQNGTINGSAYGGGNGTTATVKGNTNIAVGGTTTIGTTTCQKPSDCSLFGGGNAAATGNATNNNSTANVELAGGTIYGNVYGGANTSVVYGQTKLNLGAEVSDANITKANILVKGTVFGGGEANASGSDDYDYTFISVTKAIEVLINGKDYTSFDILGSIFGSGNASSSGGTSKIDIKNYGTYNNPKRNISIQRTNTLTIDNSALVLKGATDRTNEYSDVLFTLSIIDKLNLKNNSTLYLETGSNLLKEFNSLASDGSLAKVDIDKENGTVTKNVDNRIYMYAGKILNIATNQAVTTYGDVNGMTFFGMYKYKQDNSVSVGIYDKFEYGANLNWGDVIDDGSYVLGSHKVNHDITKDGFYSNYINAETTKNDMDYIKPTPEDAAMYMWIIGESVREYNIDLVASKYSTLGTTELSFLDFSKPNTSFEILGFDYSEIASNVTLTEKNKVPRTAASDENADNIMSLTMESSNKGWLTTGSTTFLTNKDRQVLGTTTYVGENDTSIPTMLFYLNHSKNLSTSGDMGTVKIIIMAITKIDDLTNETERLVVNVNMSRVLYNTNDYEGALTEGRKYELFASTAANITTTSSISTYFSLYTEGASVYKNGYHRALVSNYVLPENTKITMIDLSNSKTEYYSHVITADEVTRAATELATEGDIHYKLSIFELMGATNSGIYYDDASKNQEYYNSTTKITDEEFIFIVDFEDTNITEDALNNSLLIEMLDGNEETMISVLGIQHANMIYNLYANKEAVIKIDGTISSNKIYSGESVTLDLTTEYTQSKLPTGATIYDTSYLEDKLGFKITLYNNRGEVVTGASLLGLTYVINGVAYSPNIDGTTRIKVSDKVGNVKTWIRVNTGTSNLATGNYKLVVETFGSPDGIYYGLKSSASKTFDITIINEIYGLDINTDEKMMIIDQKSGNTLNGDNRLTYNIEYNSGLANPNIKVKFYRRNYDEVYDNNFTLVDLKDYITNSLTPTTRDKEYLVVNNPNEINNFTLFLKDKLQIGTYKFEFILYDDDSQIGSIDKYIIIK